MSGGSNRAVLTLSSFHIRSATGEDLPDLFRITLDGLEGEALASRVRPSDAHSFHTHALKHGKIRVAEIDGSIAGYGTVIERDGTRILSQLFVTPDRRSSGIGSALLDDLLDGTDADLGLLASDDPRAISLYARRGFRPMWPHYEIGLLADRLAALGASELDVLPDPDHDELARLDKAVSGRNRPEDLRYWLNQTGGTPYLLSSGERKVGYGWIHDPLCGKMANWYESDAPLKLGPIGAVAAGYARACVLAMANLAQHTYPGRGISIEIGGSHPALSDLLRAGGRIHDAEIAMWTDAARFGLPQLYLPSGGILL
ncbi:MAG: GNAT family N-acetyltransferase [Thermomicrobiales bacterium]